MNIYFIPFQIGMDYEHWEFDLEFLEDLHTCERYKYIKHDILEVLDNSIEAIYLYFNCDILVRVEVEFQSFRIPMTFINIVASLEDKYGKQVLSSNPENTLIQKLWKDTKKYLVLQHNLKSNTIKLVLTKREYLDI